MKNKQNRLRILVNRYKNEQKGNLKELWVKVTEMLYINKPFVTSHAKTYTNGFPLNGWSRWVPVENVY